jgi:hypothetical protein
MNKTDFRENPALWMMIGVPLFSIVTSACLIYMAISSYDGLVVDDYYKKGKEINVTLDRDKKAAEMGLNATLSLDVENEVFTAILTAETDVLSDDIIETYPQQLSAKFLHRTLSGRDVEVDLQRTVETTGIVYQGQYPMLSQSRWLVELGVAEWRLTGEILWPEQSKFELIYDPTFTPTSVIK